MLILENPYKQQLSPSKSLLGRLCSVSLTLVHCTDGSFALLCPAGFWEEHAYKLRVVRWAFHKRYGSVSDPTFLPIRACGEGRWEALACASKLLLSSFLPILSFQPHCPGLYSSGRKNSLCGGIWLTGLCQHRQQPKRSILSEPRC